MNLTGLPLTLLLLSPFILLWLVSTAIIGAQHGWRKALRPGALGLSILIILGALHYGFVSLPKTIQDGLAAAALVLVIALTLVGSITPLFAVFRKGEVWVDSKPAGFIDVGGLRFDPLALLSALLFALPMLIYAVDTYRAEFLKSGSQTTLELLVTLCILSLDIRFIILAFKRFQICQGGIVTSSGRLIRWNSISSTRWIEFRDVVILTLKHNRSCKVTVPYELRTVVEKHLEQQVGPADSPHQATSAVTL